jgi:hypothetical protein
VFVRISEELTRARYAGVPPWDALEQFADVIAVPQLADLAKIVRLSGEEGAAIYETLRARGKGLRMTLLNAEQTRANEVSESMSSHVALVGIAFLGIIATPMLMNLLN